MTAPVPPAAHTPADRGEDSRDRMLDSVFRCLDWALGAMNRAIEITTADGPAVAIEYIADFLNDTDGVDEDVADATPAR